AQPQAVSRAPRPSWPERSGTLQNGYAWKVFSVPDPRQLVEFIALRFDDIFAWLRRIDERQDRTEAWQKGMDARLDRMEARQDRMEARQDAMEGRLDRIERRQDSMEGQLDRMEGRLTKLEVLFEQFRSDFRALAEGLADLRTKVQSLLQERGGESWA
ncbi:MAG: hypothetical protein HY701_11000, partial [Gemmatimonadetes bacterium]|nr:hypothetical protein [Gemmatimonadota bacterium]